MSTRESTVAVLGGGIMGGDIATVFAAGGWSVHVASPSASTRAALPQRLAAGLARLGSAPERAEAVVVHAEPAALPWERIDLVVEAVTEDLPLKRRLFSELERLARADAVLATNTSTLPIGEIGGHLERPERVVGLHFFMPAHLVPLVEVVSAERTDPAVAAGMVAVLQALGKVPIHVAKDVPGFVGNRLQHALMREALHLVASGVASAEDVDRAVRFGFGFRYVACGPMVQKEMSGWDTNLAAAASLYPHLSTEPAPPAFLREMVERGETGMKAGRGLWEWTPESIAREKARIERCLQAGIAILQSDPGE